MKLFTLGLASLTIGLLLGYSVVKTAEQIAKHHQQQIEAVSP